MEKVPFCEEGDQVYTHSQVWGKYLPEASSPPSRVELCVACGARPLTTLVLQPAHDDNRAPTTSWGHEVVVLSWACEVRSGTWACHALFDLSFPCLVFYAFYSSPKWLSLIQHLPSQRYLFLRWSNQVSQHNPERNLDTVKILPPTSSIIIFLICATWYLQVGPSVVCGNVIIVTSGTLVSEP